jgi:hypothetical protein
MARKVGGPFSTGNMRPLLVSSAYRVDLWSLQRQRCDGRTTSILPGSGQTAIEELSRLRTTNLVEPGKSGDAQSRILCNLFFSGPRALGMLRLQLQTATLAENSASKMLRRIISVSTQFQWALNLRVNIRWSLNSITNHNPKSSTRNSNCTLSRRGEYFSHNLLRSFVFPP